MADANKLSSELYILRKKAEEDEARARYGNEINDAVSGIQASPLEATVNDLYQQLQESKAKKPAKKKPATKKADPAPSAQSRPKNALERRREQEDRDQRFYEEYGMEAFREPPQAQAPMAAPAVEEKRMSPEDRIKGVTAAQAETILSESYSTRGKHGQYTPEETELIRALQERAKGFDYGKARQELSQPYVPSWLGVKK